MTLQQASASPQEKSADQWLDDLIEEGASQEAIELKALKSELSAVKSWQQLRTQQLVSSQLETEIEAAVEKHPEVSAEELWRAVAADGTVDVDAAAAPIQHGREQLRSRYTADAQKEVDALRAQLAEAEKAASEAKAFRRPGSAAPPSTQEGRKPQSISEATSAFAEALRERSSL